MRILCARVRILAIKVGLKDNEGWHKKESSFWFCGGLEYAMLNLQ